MMAGIAAQSDPQIVIAAAFGTFAIVTTVSLYAGFTKSDFTILGPMMFIVGIALMMLAIFTAIVRFPFLNMIWCTIGIIVFGFYLIFDTQLIMGGKRY